MSNSYALTDDVFNTRFNKITETDLSKLNYTGSVAKSIDANGVKTIHLNVGMGVVTVFKDGDKYVYDCTEEAEKVFFPYPITTFFDENTFVKIPMKTSI